MRAIISRSWLQVALEYKPYIRTEFFEKNLLKNKEMVFENGVKNIQAAAYNGAHTVTKSDIKVKQDRRFFNSNLAT